MVITLHGCHDTDSVLKQQSVGSIKNEKKGSMVQVMERIHSQFQASTSEVAAVPLHGLSAKTGEGAQDLLPAAMQLYDTWNKRLTTSRLNGWKEKVTSPA